MQPAAERKPVIVADVNVADPGVADVSTVSTPELPRLVVTRAVAVPAASPTRLPTPRRIARRVALALGIWGTALAVSVAALYFQPPPVQWVMTALGLQPGGGTATPIALPTQTVTGAQGGPPPLAVPEREEIVALGILQPAADVTVLAMPFGASDARVAEVAVAEGDQVDGRQVLARLDNAADLAAAVAAAEATVALRQAELDRTRRDVTLSRDEAQARLDSARVALQNAETEFTRADQLAGRGAISTAILDDARAARDSAAREVDQLTATLARYTTTDLDTQPDVRVAAEQLRAAETDLATARQDLEKGLVRAPFAGTVLKVNVRAGERPGDVGLFEFADLSLMEAEVEVYQSDIAQVRPGVAVTITSEAFTETLKGTVDRIGLSVDRQQVVDGSPAANTDARVITIQVALDAASSAIAARYTNLQVIARIGEEAP